MDCEQVCIMCDKSFLSNSKSFLCKNCQQLQIQTEISFSLKKDNLQSHRCPKCTFENSYTSIQCEMCSFLFEEKLQQGKIKKQEKPSNEIISCKKCKFENHIANQYCLNCHEELYENKRKRCQICGFSIKQDIYTKHFEQCSLSKSLIDDEQMIKEIVPELQQPLEIYKAHFLFEPEPPKDDFKHLMKDQKQLPIIKDYPKNQKKSNKLGGLFGMIKKLSKETKINCYYCYQKMGSSEFSLHKKQCSKRIQWQQSIQSVNYRMTPLQVRAVMYMHQKSQKQHEGVRQSLQDRIRKLGYTIEDLQNLQFYIQNYAPIIIQIHVSKHMEFFIKDTHYRNQFETNKSSGSLSRQSRVQWENRMFDNKYNKAVDFERVKYGVINFTNDPKGVQCAKAYGPSYFLLKSHVRDRCTLTDKDSSSHDASIATLKFSFKIISKLNDQQLKAAFKASKALQQSSGVTITYKQLQIHGPIQFSKDIERIYVSKQQIKGQNHLLNMVYEFSSKFKVQHDFI